MSVLVQYTNKDGLTRHYGIQDVDDGRNREPRTAGGLRQIVVDFAFGELTEASGVGFYDADASGGTTPDSFSGAIAFVPSGSWVTRAYVVAVTAWTGTATLDIGFESQAGAAQDADALYNGIDVDHADTGLATIGAAIIPNGVGVGNTSGSYDPDWSAGFNTADMYVRVIKADSGTLTAGTARLVVEYMAP